jgi:antitoxin component YwqK of YwqJK toxin-antitoxin module
MRRATLTALLLLTACSQAPQEGSRELVEHWPARVGRSPVVRVRGHEEVSGGKWVKQGQFTFWDEHGRMTARGGYRGGVEHGPWEYFEPDGDVGRGEFRDGKREGNWIYSFPDGSQHEEGAYVEGVRHGYWTRWHENRQQAAELMYERGELSGTCRFFDENGKEDVQRSGHYEAGKKVD